MPAPCRRAPAAAVALAVVTLAGCSSGPEQAAGSDYKFTAVSATVDLAAQGHRQSPPGLSGQTVDGHPLRLSSLRGKVVVVNFWGSWCGPCRGEAPDLERVAAGSAAKGVAFLGVDVKDTPTNARQFERTYSISYPSLSDTDGSLAASWPTPVSLPVTFVLDREGRIAARFRLGVLDTDLWPVLNRVAAEKSAATS